MLGFSPLSAGPLSEASQTLAANGFLIGAESTLAASSPSGTGLANFTVPSATGTNVAGVLSFDAQGKLTLSAVNASLAAGGDFHSYGQANITPVAVTAASTAGTLDFDAKAFLTLVSSSGTFATPSVDFDAKANITTDSTTSATAVGTLDFDAKANITSPSATSSISVGTVSFDAKATIIPTSVEADGDAGTLGFDAQGKAQPTGVVATFAALSDATVELFATAEIELDGVQGVFTQNLGLPTAVKFDYEQFADKYSRYRTLVLLEEKQPELHFTVYIPQGETRTVFIEDANRDGLNNTVFIPKENFTVFIDALQERSTTVLITN